MLRQLKKKAPTKIAAVVTSRGDPVVLVPLVRSQRLAATSEPGPKVPTKRVTITTKLQLDYFVRDHLGTTLQELQLPWN